MKKAIGKVWYAVFVATGFLYLGTLAFCLIGGAAYYLGYHDRGIYAVVTNAMPLVFLYQVIFGLVAGTTLTLRGRGLDGGKIGWFWPIHWFGTSGFFGAFAFAAFFVALSDKKETGKYFPA